MKKWKQNNVNEKSLIRKQRVTKYLHSKSNTTNRKQLKSLWPDEITFFTLTKKFFMRTDLQGKGKGNTQYTKQNKKINKIKLVPTGINCVYCIHLIPSPEPSVLWVGVLPSSSIATGDTERRWIWEGLALY